MQTKTKLLMKDISIEFPGVKALSHVDFEMESGKIHALIGANGAGKSTLMKVLAGAYTHYTGSIYFNGSEEKILSPKMAKNLGVEIVYQEIDTALIPYLSVGENIMLNHIVNKMGKKQIVDWKQIHKKAREVLKRLNVNIDTKQFVSELTLAQKQMVLIARAVVEECRFLILDEPTAPLSNSETEELFRIVRELAKDNVGIIFISHRLPELFIICESVTIMKDGEIVKNMPLDQNVTPKMIVELMLGRKFEETFPKKIVDIGETVLNISGLTDNENRIEDISLYVRRGEIVGVSGLVGSGKTEFCKTLFGAFRSRQGVVELNGKKLSIKSPSQAVKQGFALVPEERRKEGVLVGEPVYANLSAASLTKYCNSGFISKIKEQQMASKIVSDLGIKTPSIAQRVAYLSGGNQQKVAVGKWLVADAEIYIFDEATKGVDVAAKHDIFELIEKLVDMGKGVIYASSELSEIMAITDRTYVMYDGKIQKELVTKETTEEEILYYSTGGH